MISSSNCPISGVRFQPTVRLQLCRLIRAKYSSLCTFEEIVIVMIIGINGGNIGFETI